MIIKYEKKTIEKDSLDADVDKFLDADVNTADIIHVCFHDHNPPLPCKRIPYDPKLK